MLGLKTKDPNAVLDFSIDWGPWLDTGDTIETSTWTISPNTISTTANSHTSSLATIWLTGGTVGVKYTILNHIVTLGGRANDATFKIHVVNQ